MRALRFLLEQQPDSHFQDRNMEKLTSVFPDLSDDMIHIIIADAMGMLYSVFQTYLTDFLLVLESIDSVDDLDYHYKRKVRKGAQLCWHLIGSCLSHSCVLALDENFDRIASGPSPSEVSKDPQQQCKIFGEDPSIHVGRPGGPPAAVFNTALATLQRRLDDLQKVDVHPEEVKLAANYLGLAVNYYSTEDDREEAIKTSFIGSMGGEGVWKIWYAGETKPDCSWWSDDFPIMVMELKNSCGVSGDAFIQCVVVYSKIIAQDKVWLSYICRF